VSERGRKIRPYISTETYKKKMMPEIEEDLVKPEIRRKFAGNATHRRHNNGTPEICLKQSSGKPFEIVRWKQNLEL